MSLRFPAQVSAESSNCGAWLQGIRQVRRRRADPAHSLDLRKKALQLLDQGFEGLGSRGVLDEPLRRRPSTVIIFGRFVLSTDRDFVAAKAVVHPMVSL